MKSESHRRPMLLWIAAAFWALSGGLGLLPFIASPGAIASLSGPVPAFAAAALLTHFLSLVGAGLLVPRKRFAVAALLAVFLLGIGTLTAGGVSPARISPSRLARVGACRSHACLCGGTCEEGSLELMSDWPIDAEVLAARSRGYRRDASTAPHAFELSFSLKKGREASLWM
jgi:hypothetical protein